MTRGKLAVTAIAAIVLAHGSAASADQVSGVITSTYQLVEDTDLIGNVSCEVTGAPCFSFVASGIELRLNGFSITGRADPVTGCGGAATTGESGVLTNGRNDVGVRGPGLIQRFRFHGVQVAGSQNARVENLTVSTTCAAGIFVNATSFGTLVQGNLAVRNGSSMPGLTCGGV
jgi:hypothetical protein